MERKVTRLLSLLLLIISLNAFGQDSYWKQVGSKGKLNNIDISKLDKEKYKIFELDINSFTKKLINVPLRGVQTSKVINTTTVLLPNTNGKLEKFRVYEAPVFSSSLAKKFPDIKSYIGYGESGSVVRMAVSHKGVQTMVSYKNKSTEFTQPVKGDSKKYITYIRDVKKDLEKDSFICSTENEVVKIDHNNKLTNRDANDQLLRRFRIAVSVNGEYTAYHGGTVADALAAINATLTRVNAVFETDMAVTFELVDAPQLIYTNANADPYSTNKDFWNLELQNTLTNTIGNSAYDIGHMFGASGGGGNAGCIGCVCVDDTVSTSDLNKGAGITSPANGIPEGDTFDIDFVAHEIGHQMGANHTFSHVSEQGTGVNVEPGSGSTIMGYAGITTSNVQQNSDPYFHYASIKQILDNITFNRRCWTSTNIINNPPVADAGSDYTIPANTAYVLRGSATDADGGDQLFYTWEQIDNGVITSNSFGPTNTSGAMVRSLPPSTSPNRYIPKLSRVISGQLTETSPSIVSDWETVSTVSRNLNFAFTVRDRSPSAIGLNGQSSYDDMRVTVDDSAGPFVVTSQTNNVTWNVGSSQEITWDVAGTDVGSVNTPTVNILLSHDGGQTFPVTLASAVPNDGSHTITVPQVGGNSNQVRVMVEGNNNIFYAVNSSNFTIEESEFALALDNTVVNTCTPNSAVFTFTYNTFLGFNGTTNFSAISLPANAIANFSPSSASSDGTQVTLTISGIENVALGSYPFQIQGISGSITSAASATVNVYNNNLSTPILNVPSDGQTSVSLTPVLEWSSNVNAASYDLEVATDVSFNTVVLRENIINNSYTFSNSLSSGTVYYWRVRPRNECAEGNFSNISSFTTTSCTVCASIANIAFQTSTTRVVFNTIDNSSSKTLGGYSDYRNISTNVQRGEDYNLSVQVNTDGNWTTQTLVWIDWNQDCDFDDANETYNLGTATNVANGVTSSSPLNISIPLGASLGSTIMRVSTKYAGDGSPTSCENGADAEVEDYSIVVQDATASIEDFAFEGFNLYPNPTQGAFTIRFKTISSENVLIRIMDIAGRTVFTNTYQNVVSDFSERVVLDNISSGIYLLQIQNGNKQTTRKLLIE